MRQTDQPDSHAPLGAPIRPERNQGPEWVADDPAKPHLQRNTRDGTMRNIPPTPPPQSYSDILSTQGMRHRDSFPALRSLRFVPDGSRMVKRGACRRELAEATSLDGQSWRVRPLEKGWRS